MSNQEFNLQQIHGEQIVDYLNIIGLRGISIMQMAIAKLTEAQCAQMLDRSCNADQLVLEGLRDLNNILSIPMQGLIEE